jgi:hypothetical protein
MLNNFSKSYTERRSFPSKKAIKVLCFMLSQSRVGLVVYHSLVSGGKEATDHPPIIGQYPLSPSLTTIFTVFFLSHLSFSACKSMKNGLVETLF